MKKLLVTLTAVLGASLFAGCATDADDSQTLDTDPASAHAEADLNHAFALPAIGADQEYSFFAGLPFTFRFPGFFTPQAETFFIWNFGTSIQHNAPYPSSSHGRLYGVFAPAPAGSLHHVAGQDGFDHYHIMSQGPGTRTFDVFLVFPGPNFNAATFIAPRSEFAMNISIAFGVLAAPITTTDAGFGPLVFTVPVSHL
ncbi:MAG: hypothetical protein ABIY55_34610 [Kofleriaceae bacterium]